MPLAFRTRRLFVPLLGLAMMFGVGATSPAREAPSPPADPVILPDATPEADPSKAALEERVRQLEAMVKQLSEQMRNVQSAPGSSNGPAAPLTLRTIVPVVGNPVLGVPFLGLNSNVRETGFAAFWDLHLAWFYQQWAFIGEWASGFQTYSQAAPIGAYQARTRVPVGSFYTQISYLLTGETRSSIGLVKPKSPFELRKGHYGTGAWEPFFRFEYLDIGSEVFTAGFADANEWANRMYMTHAGVDWHLTQYMKIYFDWNHAVFNQPVIFAPGRRQLTSDMFLLRFQLYF